jgi:glycine/D-amino acid oxidase-like deaminating enzyme
VTARARSHAIVVGAGIVGAACAAALARDGWRVTVVDRAFAGSGTTSVGMGHVVVMDDSPEQLALTAYAVQLWRELAPRLDRRSEFNRCGTLWLAADDAELASLAAKQATYSAAGVEAQVFSRRQLTDAEPNLRPGLTGALRVPGDGVVYPPGATLCLLEAAQSRGATIRHGVVVELLPHGVRCTGEIIEAEVVVNAAGTMAPSLTPGLAIVPRKGHLAITDRYPDFCRHQVVELGYLGSAHSMTTESVAFNVQPRATGQLLIGSSRELVGWDARVNHSVLRQMLDRAMAFLPALGALNVIRAWTGFRPATPDKLPLIGPWLPIPGVWIAAGHEGLGITTALATAELIADQLAGRRTQIDPRPYSPTRMAVVSTGTPA